MRGMKKAFGVVVFGCFLAFPLTAMGDTVSVKVNGNVLQLDQPAIIQDSRTLVPLRGVFEALGATVDWDDTTKTVIAKKDGAEVTLQIGSQQLMKNGAPAGVLEVPAQIVNERAMIPLRAVSEALGATVDWDDTTKTAIINSAGQVAGGAAFQEKQILTRDTKAQDGTVLASATISYPKFTGQNSSVTNTINQYFSDISKDAAENFLDSTAEMAKDQVKEANFKPFTLTGEYQVTYDKNNLLSVEFVYQEKVGTDVYVQKDSVVFSRLTGKQLTMKDLFSDKEGDLEEVIQYSFESMVDTNPDAFYDDAKDILKKCMSQVEITIYDGKVTFYLNPGVIGYRKTGVVSFQVEVNPIYPK